LITSSVELAALDVPARLTALGPAKLWIGLKNSDDVGLRVDLRVELFSKSDSGEIEITSATLSDVATGSAGFARALLYSVPLALPSPVEIPSGSSVNLRVAARRTCGGAGHAAGTVRLWYNGAPIDTGACRDAGSRFTAAIGGLIDSCYLRPNSN